MSKEIVLSFIRHALTFGGGFLVSKGALDAAALEAGIGAITTLVGIGLSFWDKRQRAA